MSQNPADHPKDPEELLNHLLEGEVDPDERQQAEAFLLAHPESKPGLNLERCLMDKLATLPGEAAPPEFAARVLAQAPAFPGSFLHRLELTLARFFMPSLVAVSVLGGLVAVGLLPSFNQGLPQVASSGGGPSNSFALLETGSAGALLPHDSVKANGRKALPAGQLVQIGFGSSAVLRFPGGVVARLAGGTRFSVGEREIQLQQGKVRVSVKPGIGNFQVLAPEASAHVIGTEFEVEAGSDGTSVAVLEGKVEVRAPGAASEQITAGQSARVRRGAPGSIERGTQRPIDTPLAEAHPAQTPEGVPGLDR